MTPLQKLPAPLLAWYGQNARVLPWRSDPTPYHVWISEIMLQQTRVAAVLDYYRRFLEALPTVEALARCPEDRLLKLWQGLGYYGRVRNLQKAARQVLANFAGEFPSRLQDIRSLAGIGDYTAGAIASIAFGQAVPAVDGNVLRVLSRLGDDHREMGSPPVKREIASALEEIIPRDRPGDFNQALMDLGAMVCLPNGDPLCGQCPAAEFCLGRLRNTARELPAKPSKKPREVQDRWVYLIFREDRVVLRRRPDKGLLAGLWEYPNEPAPWPCPVAGRTVPAGTGRHIFTHIEWQMEAFAVESATEDLPEGWVWTSGRDLEEKYPLPSAFRAFEKLVRSRLSAGSPHDMGANKP